MGIRVQLLVFLSAIFLLVCAHDCNAICVEVGSAAPSFSITDIDGNPVSLQDYRGKAVFLAFWASWCSRCQEELTYLQTLYGKLSDDMIVLAVNQETESYSNHHLDGIRSSTKALGVTYPILLDRELKVWDAYCINALPTSVIVGKDGRVMFAEPNYYWASQEKIEQVLTEMGLLGAPAKDGT